MSKREQTCKQLEHKLTPDEIICVNCSDRGCLELNMIKKLQLFLIKKKFGREGRIGYM